MSNVSMIDGHDDAKTEMVKIVIVKHSQNGQGFLFSVPFDKHLQKGDMVAVMTRKGEAFGECICDSFFAHNNVADALAVHFGGRIPLMPVIGTMTMERWGDDA